MLVKGRCYRRMIVVLFSLVLALKDRDCQFVSLHINLNTPIPTAVVQIYWDGDLVFFLLVLPASVTLNKADYPQVILDDGSHFPTQQSLLQKSAKSQYQK